MVDFSPIAEAIAEHWGERCDDFNPDCRTCMAWKAYDRIAALEAKLAARTGGVKVKALEWEERVGVEGTFDAYTSIGHYIATITDDDRGMWFVVGLTQSNYCAPDIDIVKAAAQADYERRILSALSPAPEAQQARPAEQAVTKEMVARALEEYICGDHHTPEQAMRAALKAAMEAGR